MESSAIDPKAQKQLCKVSKPKHPKIYFFKTHKNHQKTSKILSVTFPKNVQGKFWTLEDPLAL